MSMSDAAQSALDGVLYVVDDDRSLRETLCKALLSRGFKVVSCNSVDNFFANFVRVCPAVIIVDMRMPVSSGLDLLRRVREAQIQTPVIFVSGESTAPEAVKALKDGATDFLFKPVAFSVLLAAVENALTKDREAEERRLIEQHFRDRYASLTPRERELCPYVARDEKIKTIAAALSISEPTVKIHKARILKKLGVSSAANLAVKLAAHQLTNH